MLDRYNKIQRYIDQQDNDLIPLLLSPQENAKIASTLANLKKINDVTIALQAESMDKSQSRLLLEGLINLNLIPNNTHPEKQYLTKDAVIIKNKDFEQGIVNVIDGKPLCAAQVIALKKFKRPPVIIEQPKEEEEEEQKEEHKNNFAADLLLRNKRQRLLERPYLDLKWIPATSVLAERSFSQSGLIYTELRQSMSPYHLECLMFLKYNKTLWDAKMISVLINNHGSPLDD